MGRPAGRAGPGAPDDRAPRKPRAERADRDTAQPDRPRPVPPDAVTRQAIDLPGRSLHFTATAGFARVFGEDGAPEADIGMTAYTLDGADPATRPVTFVLNGGPGTASAFLQMGAVGPWRIALVPGASSPAVPQPNADTWLDFTDLVFVDPAGTGYSALLGSARRRHRHRHDPAGDGARKRVWSVEGDVDSLSQAIRRWLDRAGRITSTKYLLGESYGGFRAPRLARRLAEHDGVGLRGLVMLSPAIDFGNHSNALDVLGYAMRLPSMAAAVRSEQGEPVARADLAEVEDYATGAFLSDALKGVADPAATDRLVDRVAAITGLDRDLVRRRRGLVGGFLFQREHDRGTGRIDSAYDTTVSLPDAYPESPERPQPDPSLGALEAPVTEAVLWVYDRLRWHPEGPLYRLSDPEVNRRWDWGRGLRAPESLDALRLALAGDPALHVLVGARPVRPRHALRGHAGAAEPDPALRRRRPREARHLPGRPHVLQPRRVARGLPGGGGEADRAGAPAAKP